MSAPIYCPIRQQYCRCHDFGKRCDDFDEDLAGNKYVETETTYSTDNPPAARMPTPEEKS